VRVGAVAVAAVLVVSPWVFYNLSRFNHPVTISTGFGTTLGQANCDEAYYGPLIGYYSLRCLPDIPKGPKLDQSDDELFVRKKALDYVDSHRRRIPLVLLARLGRTFNVFHVAQGVDVDFYEGRPYWGSDLALAFFYPTMALAVYGAVLCRRRRIPITPLVAPLVMVTLAALLTFGQTRYRAPAEGAICLLAAVGIDGLLAQLSGRAAGRSDASAREQPA
jgi:hypothetical protein